MASPLNKLLRGKAARESEKCFLRAFLEKTGKSFRQTYPGVWEWLVVYYHIRSNNETLDKVIKAFSDKIDLKNQRIHDLETRIGRQKAKIRELSDK